eukprot:356894-Chlamydomonas_euryale.AAC.8
MTELLKEERRRLANSVQHLERSNCELKRELDEHGKDADLKDAVQENCVVIAKYRARVAALDEEIRRLEEATCAVVDGAVDMQVGPDRALTSSASAGPSGLHVHSTADAVMLDDARSPAHAQANMPAQQRRREGGGTPHDMQVQPPARPDNQEGVWL